MMPVISSIEAYVIDGGWRNYVLVRVVDGDGNSGCGEASIQKKDASVAKATIELGEQVLGREVSGIESLWHDLYTRDHWRGGVIHNSALSAIDTALWDLHSQYAGMPLWRVLGGNTTPAVRLYANGWFRSARNDEEVLEAAVRTVKLGFTGLKWNPFLPAFHAGEEKLPSTRRQALSRAANLVHQVRQVVGPTIDLMVECHGLLKKEEALFLIEAVADAEPLFIEEPVHPMDFPAMKWVIEKSPAPIASGERWFTRWDVWPILSQLPLAVLQPDICHCGGVSELRKVASLAEAAGVQIAPHNSAGPLATLATAHVAASCSNFLILELFHEDPGWKHPLFTPAPLIKDGHLHLQEERGLGLQLAPDILKNYALEVYHTTERR